MSERKRYATRKQRLLIESAGGSLRKGMLFEEAERGIAKLLQQGRLTEQDIENAWRLEPPTRRQSDYLTRLDVKVSNDLTRGQASDLIDGHMRDIPMTRGQEDFIRKLHGLPQVGMSSSQAGQYIALLLERQPECTNCGYQFSAQDQRCLACGAFLPEINPNRFIYSLFPGPVARPRVVFPCLHKPV